MSATSTVREVAARESDMRQGLLGYAAVLALVGIALLIYFVGAEGIGKRGTWFVVGEVIGISAAVLLPVAAILAVRLRPLEWLFGDMTKVYIAHGIVGLTMFGLVTAHPLLYVVGALPHTRAAAHIIVPFHLVVLDWISWLLIAGAMVPTLFVRLRFDWWRSTHLLLGAAVALTAVSLLLTSETFDTFKVPALRIYLFVLFALGIAAVIYVSFVRRIAEPKHEYRVVGAEHHTEARAVELRLSPVGRPLAFEAGQFAYVDLLDDRVQVKRDFEAHPFSIASAPSNGDLLVVVETGGRYTERVQGIVAGDEAHALLHGAYGRLGYAHARAKKQLWIGGGIGVTPFLSMAEEIACGDGEEEILFVVGVDRAEQAFYLDRLREHEARCPRLKVLLWCADERGHPTADALLEHLPDLHEHAVLLSGPEAMVSDLTGQLHRAGVPRERIHSEIAIGPPRRWRYAPRGLRVMRAVIAAELAVFVGAVVVSTVGRAVS